jgi:quinol-cytochrome oxidoreductase complex cytochrome b subunit
LFEPFDPKGSTPDGIKPEWYFFWVYYPLELLPLWVILVGSALLGIVLMATPWIFKNTNRKTLQLIAIAAGIYLIVMTFWGENIYHLFKG